MARMMSCFSPKEENFITAFLMKAGGNRGRSCRLKQTKSRLGAFTGRLCLVFGIESGNIAKRHCNIRRIILITMR
jgi:hypothetical protein